MPRTADHGARRREVAGALMRVVARQGLADASLAAVAAEAGVSVGLIQRYFSTKRDLLRFAFEYVEARAVERLDRVPSDGPVRDVVYAKLETLLPLDEERRAESSVWVGFLAAGLADRELLAPHQIAMRSMHEAIAVAIHASGAEDTSPDQRASAGEGGARGGLGAVGEARLLTSVVDGLVLDMVTSPEDVPPSAGKELLRIAVDRAFGLVGAADSGEPAADPANGSGRNQAGPGGGSGELGSGGGGVAGAGCVDGGGAA
ncbi:TetR family transcriptional regulator C-terminal domain-containing protein [Kribbella sp. NPDC023972]|uniref:TetR/AcrR family transcriptional regulator n=1 Tax=Kribbella sp. NPDC023972 TaxID=3154795 RepID=UPI0033F75773